MTDRLRRILRGLWRELYPPGPEVAPGPKDGVDFCMWVIHGYPSEKYLPPGHPERAQRLKELDEQRHQR